MKRSIGTIATLVCGLICILLASGSAMAQEEKPVDRGAQILANLIHIYPELANRGVVMGAIEPSGYSGLDKGTFTLDGSRTQRFFVSPDNKQLYLLSGEPLDVSRSAAEIEAEDTKATAARVAELNTAIKGKPFRGRADAPVTIVEFSDFQCPYCSRANQTVDQVLEKHKNDVKLVFMNFPLSFHPWAVPAAIAAQCAFVESPEAFWALHDAYFRDQKALTAENLMEKTKGYLAGSGLDMKRWSSCVDDSASEAHKTAAATIDADLALGQKHGVDGTPGFFINGVPLSGAQPITAFERLIEAAKPAGEAAK